MTLPAPGRQLFNGNPNAGIKPAVQVTGRAAGTGDLYYGRAPNGQYYRYSGQNGQVHWSGTVSREQVPNWIRKLLK